MVQYKLLKLFQLHQQANLQLIAPGIDEKPPIIKTGKAFNASSIRANWTPALAPHIMPATRATIPAVAHTRIIICFKGIPIELAAPGSSATARKPSPIFVYLNNSVKKNNHR